MIRRRLKKVTKENKQQETPNESDQCLKNINNGKLTTFVIMGEKCTGKTSLISRFILGSFSHSYTPTVEECYFKQLHDRTSEEYVNIRVIDTSGYYHFPAMQRLNIANADVLLLAYEVSNVVSMKRAIQLFSMAKEVLRNRRTLPVVIIGTKIDEHKDTNNYQNETMQEFLSLNSDTYCRHILTSARLDINVTDAFQLGCVMLQQLKTQHIPLSEAHLTFSSTVLAKMRAISRAGSTTGALSQEYKDG